MKKILIISPISIAGCLIMKGFLNSFENLGFTCLFKDIRKIDEETIERFEPKIIFGYDYSYLVNEDLKNFFSKPKNYLKYHFVHYFADVPNYKTAFSDKPELFGCLQNICEKFESNTWIFCWEKTYLRNFKKAFYIPLGVDFDLYQTDFKGFHFDISFVGRPIPFNRTKILTSLIENYGNQLSIFCYRKHFDQSIDSIDRGKLLTPFQLEIYKNCYKGFLENEQQLGFVFNHSKINLNILQQGENNMNLRVLEVLGSKGFLLTDDVEEVKMYFKEGKMLDIYRDEQELKEKIQFYLKNLNLSKKIAINGYNEVILRHSCQHRLRDILYLMNIKN